MSDSKIPTETRQRMLNALVPLGKRLFDHSEGLQDAGFTAWTVLYEDSILGCQDTDLVFHRTFLIEAAKEEMGNGELPCVILWGAGTGYKSELLTRLRRERDAAGFDRSYFSQNSSENWRCWLSPCWIERHRIASQESARHWQLVNARITRLREERVNEAARLARVEWPPAWGETKVRRFIARRLLDETLLVLDFRFRRDLSIPGWIVFSRPLREDWELRFGLEVADLHLSPYIFACKTSLRKELKVWPTLYDPQEYVEVMLHHSAVEFARTYHHFTNDEEFEVCVRAVLFLYKLEHDFITSVISANI